MELLEFYPTPDTLLEKILDGVDLRKIGTVLEPSAGKGNIASYIIKRAEEYPYYNKYLSVDCIEKDETLQKTLVGSDLRLIHDDFLTFSTFKSYDMVIMNPPFSEGDKHLTKAMDLQEKTGGDIICILNAETIRNPYTNLRKALVKRLDEHGAVIEYMKQEFSSAERQTDVEIAVVKVHFEAPQYTSSIFEELKRKAYEEESYNDDVTDLAPGDFVKAIVKAYEMEVEAGIKLIREYRALKPRLTEEIGDKCTSYSSAMLELKCGSSEASVNAFVEQVRMKYWRALFTDSRITGHMTSNLQRDYLNRVNELKNYDFSEFNIKAIQAEMSKHLIKGVEDCIIELFDDLSHRYSYYDTSANIHYYNGWATNKAWIINKKVIVPFYANVWSQWSKEYQPDNYDVIGKLSDIEKALNYLDGGLTDSVDMVRALRLARSTNQTKNIRLKFFDVTFYKKGTCHIVFRDEELLKKFNIFGSQKKGWLPPSYGKKTYSEMNEDEQRVVDEFEGMESYNKTMCNRDYYLFKADSIAMIEEKTA